MPLRDLWHSVRVKAAVCVSGLTLLLVAGGCARVGDAGPEFSPAARAPSVNDTPAPENWINGATVGERAVRIRPPFDPAVLSWAPPTLVDPVTVTVGPEEVVDMDDDQDYRVIFPDVPVEHGVVLAGGRNVVVIGGEINIPWQGADAGTWERRALMIRGQTGVVHIEGLLMTGEDLTEGINIDAPEAIVQLQNVRIEHVHARDQVNFSDNHPDVIQPWGGVAELRLDRLTAQTDYQGIFLKEDYGTIGPSTLRRVHIQGDPTARYLYWNENRLLVHLDRAYVSPAPGRSLRSTLWPTPSDWPGMRVGPPPREFVPPGLAGIGYEAWDYAEPVP